MLARQSGYVAARSRQTRNDAGADRIGRRREYDRDGRCCMLCGDERWSVMRENDIDLQPDELGRELGEAFAASLRPTILDRDGAAFYPAEFAQSLEVRSPDDFNGAFEKARRQRPDALIEVEDPLTNSLHKRIVEFAAAEQLPSLHGIREEVETGGLISYGASVPDLFRRAAGYVDKILKGAKPADLPVEQPTTFELVINLKTARALGLDVPPTLLARADEVIE